MELRYMGFDQTENNRTYSFERVITGEAVTRFVITADLTLFREYRISIQDGPALCAEKLASDLRISACDHELTRADLVAHVAARSAAEALKNEERAKRKSRASAQAEENGSAH